MQFCSPSTSAIRKECFGVVTAADAFIRGVDLVNSRVGSIVVLEIFVV
jgi:hypothetical protein